MAGNRTMVKDASGNWVDLAYVATGPQGPAGPGLVGGGSTGQVLRKKSATNYDTEWVAEAAAGPAGGVLSGTYPNPGMAANAAKTNLKMAWGTSTVTCTNPANGLGGNVPHGLGVTPPIVLATARTTPDTRDDWVIDVRSRDATNLVFALRAAAGETYSGVGAVVTFDWLALG